MRRGLLGLLLGLGFMANVWAAQADVIEVRDPFVRRVPPVSKVTAAYMTLINRGDREAMIVGAHTSAAKNVELHETVNEGGLLRMRKVARFVVPPQGMLAIDPGGLHFMLIGLAKPLAANEPVELVLEFADGSRKEVRAIAR